MAQTLPAAPACEQLVTAGLAPYVRSCRLAGEGVRGVMDPAALAYLRGDTRFAEGCFWQLHGEVGTRLADFRSYNGSTGRGSLQIVIDEVTGAFYSDVDRANPYQDVVHFCWHAFGEVVPGWCRSAGGWFTRRFRGR